MQSSNVRMTQQGLITIPKPLRESYGLQPGETLETMLQALREEREQIYP
jgi:AbrB family looped-hinge helix DNA binding protein